MILTVPVSVVNITGIPRESGDDPEKNNPPAIPNEYSPRERG